MSIWGLIRLRIPTLFLGLLLGLILSFLVSGFEKALEVDLRIAYFVPLIVYMADAIGTQTQSIYTRDLLTGKASFKKYLFKETLLGILLGLLFGSLSGGAVFLWLKSFQLALAVFWGMFGSVALSPFISMVVTEIFELEHSDPAVGAGPIATVIHDTASVVIFGLVCSSIFL